MDNVLYGEHRSETDDAFYGFPIRIGSTHLQIEALTATSGGLMRITDMENGRVYICKGKFDIGLIKEEGVGETVDAWYPLPNTMEELQTLIDRKR